MVDENKLEEIPERNLVADLSGDIMSKELLESNPVYSKYMPYYARRQFFKGQRDEALTDVDINSEYSTLGAYGQRKRCSTKHFTRLLNYVSETEELMAARNKIIRFYFCNAVWSEDCDCLALEDYQKRFGKENLVNIITTFVGIGKPDTTLMLAFAQLLLFSTREKFVQEYGTDFMDRIILYIFLHGPLVSKHNTKNDGFYSQFGDDIARIISTWGDTTMKVDICKIDFNYIAKYGDGMLARAQRLFEHPWFSDIRRVNEFISAHSKNFSDEEVDGFLSRKSNLYTFAPDKITSCDSGIYMHITKLHYLMKNMPDWPIYWNYIKTDKSMYKFLSGAIVCGKGDHRSSDAILHTMIIRDVMEYTTSMFIEAYPAVENASAPVKPDPITLIHIQAMFVLFRRCMGRDIRVAKSHISDLVRSTCFPNIILQETMRLNHAMRHKKYEFTDKELEEFLAIADTNIVIGCANIGSNLEFLKARLGELFVEMPYSVVTNNYNSMCSDGALDWVWDVITKEQRKFFPFPTGYMKKNQYKFAEYLCNLNTDRYIMAYGLNWVEQHGTVSVSDLVKSGTIRALGRNVIERYLDIILLDDELRAMFLAQHRYSDISYLNDAVLTSTTFSNAIKCEFLATKYSLNAGKIDEDAARRDCAYIAGSGLSGYKFLYTLSSKDITPELKAFLTVAVGYINIK